MMLSGLLLHVRSGFVTLNRRWNTESVRHTLIYFALLVLLIALIALVSLFTPMANAG